MKAFRVLTPILGIALTCVIIWWFLPLPDALSRFETHNLRIEDRNGNLLYERTDLGRRSTIPFERISHYVKDAVVAVEDRTFWTNSGINFRGIFRALVINIRAGKIVQGGSGITQQFIRSRLQPRKRGFAYKLHEAVLAVKITTKKSKAEILSLFLSSAFYGSHSYGIEAAAATYFDTTAESLTLSQSAFLVGLLNAPTSLNPYRNLPEALSRRDLVLEAMRSTGVISQGQLEQAKSEYIELFASKDSIKAPHFVHMILEDTNLSSEKTIRTTLDLSLQEEAQKVVDHQLDLLKDKNVSSAAVVVMDASNGDILALIGSRDFFDSTHDGQVNVAVSRRQPGSALKPFTYALAFNDNMTPATTIADVSVQYFTEEGNPYTPRNYDYEEHGPVRLREALANSYNIAAVKVLEKIGVATLYEFLGEVGISTLTKAPEHYGLALTLGDAEVKLLELVSAYSVFPNRGEVVSTKIVKDSSAFRKRTSLKPTSAWLVTSILSDASARLPEFGSSSPLNFTFPVAVKTGTTRNSRDNWTIGYTQNVIVGVWVGNANNEPMRGTSGVTGAGPIFHDIMILANQLRPSGEFIQPVNITSKRICRLSGKLPGDHCTETIEEYFEIGTVPVEVDTMRQFFFIDTRNGLLANENCDQIFVQKKLFTVYPRELSAWALSKGIEIPPVRSSPLCSDSSFSSARSHDALGLTISRPAQGATFLLDPTIPNASEMIILRVTASPEISEVDWLVDGLLIGSSKGPEFQLKWMPTVGRHTIRATTKDLMTDEVTISVLE